MFQQKRAKVEDNKEVVHFSDNQTFYYKGILFKIFKTGSKHPKAPVLALLKVDTEERVSGLFQIGSNLYQGDTKSSKGKVYFRIHFSDKNTIELSNFNTALIESGYITPEVENNPFTEDYRAPQSIVKGATGIQDYSERGIWISGKSAQLKIATEPI